MSLLFDLLLFMFYVSEVEHFHAFVEHYIYSENSIHTHTHFFLGFVLFCFDWLIGALFS